MELDPNMTFNMSDILAGNSSDLEEEKEEPWSYLDMAWTAAFSLIVTISLVGNCLVIWIVTGELELPKSTELSLRQKCQNHTIKRKVAIKEGQEDREEEEVEVRPMVVVFIHTDFQKYFIFTTIQIS